jgi:hypothetical protein
MTPTPIVLSRYSEHDRAHAERIHRELAAMGFEPRGETVEQLLERELALAGPGARHHVPPDLDDLGAIDEAEAPAYVLLFWSAQARAHSSPAALSGVIGQAERQSSVIVPVRLDDTELPGLLGSISSIDARGGPDAELAAVRAFLGREGFGPDRRPRELAPRPRGAVSCRDTLGAMQNRALRQHLKARLSLNDVREIWIDTFGSRLDDDLPQAPLGLALAELLLRADQRRVRDDLLAGLCAGWPHLGGGSLGIDGLEPPQRSRRAEASPPAASPAAASPPGNERAANTAPAVAAPSGSTAPASTAAPSGAPLRDAGSAAELEIDAAKKLLERDFAGFWGAKVFWLALLTLLPLLAPLKLHVLHLDVSPASLVYGVYHGVGIWLWANVHDALRRPALYHDRDWRQWQRWEVRHHHLGYAIYVLIAVTLLGKLNLVFLGSHTIPFPSWVKEFVGV